MLNVGDKVRIKNPDIEEQGELLSKETISVLKSTDFTGEISQIQDGLNYVGFIDKNNNWVTQVFKDDEIEVVK